MRKMKCGCSERPRLRGILFKVVLSKRAVAYI